MNSTPQPAIGVTILGAGASVRMGRPKLLMPWRETTVIGQIIFTWRELRAAQIVVVMRPDDAMLSAELDRLGFPEGNRILNPRPDQGMFSSVLCAANWPGWQKEIAAWAIVLGDQPHLNQQGLQKLVAFEAQHLDKISQPAVGGRIGHPVILSQMAFDELKRTKAATLKEFLKLRTASCVQFEMADPGVLLDMDTPEDYIRLAAS